MIAKPVEKVSGVAAGIAHGVSTLKKRKNVGDAMDAAKEAARRSASRTSTRTSGGGPDADDERAADPDADARADAEARPVAPPGADAQARSGARSARRAPLTARIADDQRRRQDVASGRAEPDGHPGTIVGMRTTAELREGFLAFFEEREHLRFPSLPLIPPPEDPSTLFISAGMQPLKPYFSGVKQPPAPRFTTVQKCLRAGGKDTDLDEVGLTARHASMFEMLGNFSFGDYFKDGAIDFAWEFVTEHIGFAARPPLGVGLRRRSRARARRGRGRGRRPGCGRASRASASSPFPRSDNFWGPAGETGPCGPCSELHYDRGPEHGCGEPDCGPNCERCDRFIEFWNLVFMEFDLARRRLADAAPEAEHRHRDGSRALRDAASRRSTRSSTPTGSG